MTLSGARTLILPVVIDSGAVQPFGLFVLFQSGCRYCEYNPNPAFASCDVPQELTNEEIDQEAVEVKIRAVYCC